MVVAFLKMNPFHHLIYNNPNGRNVMLGGEYNGYVAFDNELPLSWQGGKDQDDETALDNFVNVHGGITLDGSMESFMGDSIIPITALPDPDRLEKFRVIGFDTLHYGDTEKEWSFDRTKEETLQLMKQIENLCKEA